MRTYWNRRKATRSKRASLFVIAVAVLLLQGYAFAQQLVLPDAPPKPSNYGTVVLGEHSTPYPGAVVFDHWLHRAKFTCRVCHVDIGFAMKAKATGIRAISNKQGFHCGACHDGKRVIDGKVVFASCSDAPGEASDHRCMRCHSAGKKGVRTYEYGAFTAHLPKGIYGVNWEAAESTGAIKPIDYLEGVSVKRAPMESRQNFSIPAKLPWVHPITFSHEKHTVWNGCELCHPEIFATAKRGEVGFSMYTNVHGKSCGACHGKVASPLNNCQKCHPRGPEWADDRNF